MSTRTQSIEELVAQVKARRQSRGTSPETKSGWAAAFGAVKDDELFREAARLGEEWRRRENERR